MIAREDAGAIEIPTTLLVWVIVLAFSLPPIVGAVGAIEKARASRATEAEAETLARVAERAYSVGIDGNVLSVTLRLPDGRSGSTEYLAVGNGDGAVRTLLEWKIIGKPIRHTSTSPEVVMTGPGCEPFLLGPGLHDLVVEFHTAAPASCPDSYTPANFVLVRAAEGG